MLRLDDAVPVAFRLATMTGQTVARGYDVIAETYDRDVEGDGWMRSILWQHYRSLFKPGQRVLDVACGTGLDAAFLARIGIQVTAIDVSPAMIERARHRAASERLEHLIDARLLDLSELRNWCDGGETFDGIISSFAGLSTLPDLGRFAGDAARLLPPGGRLVIHLLNRFSLWEWLALLRRGRWREAYGLGNQSRREFTIGGQQVTHYLYYPGDAYERHFAAYFALVHAYSLGSLRPPHTLQRLPVPLVSTLGSLDQRFGHRPPLLNWGRFFVLDLDRRGPGTVDSRVDRDGR